MLTIYVILFFLIIGFWLYVTRTTAKSAIIQPVKNGLISQQKFMSEKSILTVFLESDGVMLVRNILALIGLASIIGWLL